MAVLTVQPKEQSVVGITISFFDETGAAVTPSAATWTLTDTHGVIVNGRSAVSISGLSTTATIVLSGADLAISPAYAGQDRYLLITYTYTSSLGSGLVARDQIKFTIEPLAGIA